jgi:glycosyltransferase involved in cell wall biosynthesis
MVVTAAEYQARDRISTTVAPQNTVRVLHIVENLNHQAVETWLLRVLRGAANDYPHVQWTFFCALGRKGSLDDEARQLGADVIHSRYDVGDKRRFLLSLREVMKEGRYDVLHCHHDIMSAVYLAASAGLPFRKRIVHVHNTSLSLPTPSRIKADLVRGPMRQVCLRVADQIVGISKEALESMIGKRIRQPERHQVVHYAVDTLRFANPVGNAEVLRRDLGLASATKILLFVGRLVEYKNPSFVVEILEHVAKVEPGVVAVFAGAGDKRDELRELARRKSLSDRIRLLGFREDVPELMLLSDLLVWPSLEDPKEGLGLGIVEAQAAGLPVLMSRSVPDEAIVVPELVRVLPLANGSKAWADAALEILRRPRPSRQRSREQVESSSFSMSEGVKNIIALYNGLASDR